MTKTFKLMPDYGCSPLWASGGDVGNIALDSLTLRQATRAALRAWADAFDSTLNKDDPRHSGFRTKAEADAFDVEGRRLWGLLRRELPDTKVVYFSVRDRTLYD